MPAAATTGAATGVEAGDDIGLGWPDEHRVCWRLSRAQMSNEMEKMVPARGISTARTNSVRRWLLFRNVAIEKSAISGNVELSAYREEEHVGVSVNWTARNPWTRTRIGFETRTTGPQREHTAIGVTEKNTGKG